MHRSIRFANRPTGGAGFSTFLWVAKKGGAKETTPSGAKPPVSRLGGMKSAAVHGGGCLVEIPTFSPNYTNFTVIVQFRFVLIAKLPLTELESILDEIVEEAGVSDRTAIRLFSRMIATRRDLIADRRGRHRN